MGANLVGQKFGKLTVVSLVVSTPYSKKAWLCKCDCGKVCIRLESSLKISKRDGRISSCGCYIKPNLTTGDALRCSKAGSHRKDAYVNGSNVQMTFREGTIQTNTSGCQGVSWSKTSHKWHCYVGYQNYRANLGYYEEMEDAIRIRKLAEEAIKEGTFEDFYFRIRGHHLGEKQIKQIKNRPRKYPNV